MQAESKTVKILDARKHELGPFSDTGFTLIQLDKVLVFLFATAVSTFSDCPGTPN